MKNNEQNEIKEARAGKLHKVMPTDILVTPRVVEVNQESLAQRPRRKRRTNYAKKILNDPFIFTV